MSRRLSINLEEEIGLVISLLSNKKKKELVNLALIEFLKKEENLSKFFKKNEIELIKKLLSKNVEKKKECEEKNTFNEEEKDIILNEKNEKKIQW